MSHFSYPIEQYRSMLKLGLEDSNIDPFTASAALDAHVEVIEVCYLGGIIPATLGRLLYAYAMTYLS